MKKVIFVILLFSVSLYAQYTGGSGDGFTVSYFNETISSLPAISHNNFLPEKPTLIGNYPNPFNPQTRISFYLPQQSKVRLVIYDILGKKVKELANKTYSKGKHNILFTLSSNLSSGVYICHFQSGSANQYLKMVAVR